MNTEERERALLRFVEEERDKVCRDLLADARARARALIRDAYRRNRAALHQRVVAERTRAEGLLRGRQRRSGPPRCGAAASWPTAN
jgi:hypothetical protein